MKNKICISSTLVFPPNVENELKNNLLSQLSMMLTFLSHYQNEVHTVLVSNDIKTVSNLMIKKGFQYENFDILEIKNEELNFCNDVESVFSKYHFSKLDNSIQATEIINFVEENKNSHRPTNNIIIGSILCAKMRIKLIFKIGFMKTEHGSRIFSCWYNL